MAFLSIEAELALGWRQTAEAKRLLCVSCPCCDRLMPTVEDAGTRCTRCSWRPGELVTDCRPPVVELEPPAPPPGVEAPPRPTSPAPAPALRIVKCSCGIDRSHARDFSQRFVSEARLGGTPTQTSLTVTSIELRACRGCGNLYIDLPPQPDRVATEGTP